MLTLVESGDVSFKLGQVTELHGEDGQLRSVTVKGPDGATFEQPTEIMMPFFGLTMKLGPVADWGLELHENLIPSTPRNSRRARRASSPLATSTPIPASSSSSCQASMRRRSWRSRPTTMFIRIRSLCSNTRRHRRAYRRSSA
jgi:hypothetical protein